MIFKVHIYKIGEPDQCGNILSESAAIEQIEKYKKVLTKY